MLMSFCTKDKKGRFLRVLYQLILITSMVFAAILNVQAADDVDMEMLIDDFAAGNPGLEQAMPYFAQATGGSYINFNVYSLGTTTKLFSSPKKFYKSMACSDPTAYRQTPSGKRSGSYVMFSMKQECDVNGAPLKHGAVIYVAKLSTPSQAWLYQYQLGGGTEFISAGFIPDANNDGIKDVAIYRMVETANGMDMISIVKDAKRGTTISSKQYPVSR